MSRSVSRLERETGSQLLLQGCGVVDPDPRQQWRAKSWPAMKEQLRAAFRTKTRDEWCAQLEVSDACVTPVLSLEEAPGHHHNQSRQTFVEVDGLVQPAPAPRFSRTPGEIRRPPPHAGQHSDEVLAEIGYDEARIAALRGGGAIA